MSHQIGLKQFLTLLKTKTSIFVYTIWHLLDSASERFLILHSSRVRASIFVVNIWWPRTAFNRKCFALGIANIFSYQTSHQSWMFGLLKSKRYLWYLEATCHFTLLRCFPQLLKIFFTFVTLLLAILLTIDLSIYFLYFCVVAVVIGGSKLLQL